MKVKNYELAYMHFILKVCFSFLGILRHLCVKLTKAAVVSVFFIRQLHASRYFLFFLHMNQEYVATIYRITVFFFIWLRNKSKQRMNQLIVVI